MFLRGIALSLTLYTSAACAASPVVRTDAGMDATTDASQRDASMADAGSGDGGILDAEVDLDGGPDATPVDGAPLDTGPPDATVMLPLPNMRSTVFDLADERPDLLAESCIDDGGTNEFLFELVRRLRVVDDRWGMNWKRGREGDLSQDVVDYHYGAGPREGSTDVYIIDVIADHCGTRTRPGWIDQTEGTAAAGTIGRWTLAPLP